MNTKRFGIATLAAAALLAAAPALAKPPTAQNGTTLAASKTLEICVVPDVEPTLWRFYGEIAVWNEGAIDTVGLTMFDFIEQKAPTGPTWLPLCSPADITPTPTVIPAGTTQETALLFDYVCESDAGSLTDDVRNTVEVKILNHSGHLGIEWGPEPKATVYAAALASLPLCEGGDLGCTYTIGYWGTHHEAWPEGYSPDDAFYTSGYTWGALLPPVNAGANSNGYIQLARQYIGATLNMAKEEDPAVMPDGLQFIYDQATQYFSNTTTTAAAACPTPSSCGLQKTWAATLDTFNNGEYPDGPLHCGDEAPE
jgi:hypothetical protein